MIGIFKGIAEQFPGMALMAVFAWLMLRMLAMELRRYHKVLDGVLLRIADKLDRMDDKIDALERRKRDR